MADQFHDSTPAVGHSIGNDIPDIAESLGFIKDVFQGIGTGWSNTDATGFTLDKHHKEKESLSADSSVTWIGISSGKLYKVVGVVDLSYDGMLYLRFGNSGGIDTGNNYSWSQYSIGGAGQLNYSNYSFMKLIGSNDRVFVDLFFMTVPGDNTKALVKSTSVCWETSDNDADQLNINGPHGYYDGASEITQVQLYIVGGTLTGTLWLIEDR